MASAIFVLVLSCGAIAAGAGYVRAARRMRSFRTTRGRVTGRELGRMTGRFREGRWGSGGNYTLEVTYAYTVDGVAYTSSRWGYARRGLRRSLAEQRLAAVPDEVDVHYDPSDPQVAYLQLHRPAIGLLLVAGGLVGVLGALIALLGS